MRLKPNSVPEFTRKLEKDVIPLLHKQKGFKDELTFVSKGDREVVAISVWDREEDAEAYHSGGYPKVMTLLSNVVEGTIHVQGGEVSNSTFHRIAATAAVQ